MQASTGIAVRVGQVYRSYAGNDWEVVADLGMVGQSHLWRVRQVPQGHEHDWLEESITSMTLLAPTAANLD